MKTSSSPTSSPELFDHSLRCSRMARYDSSNDFIARFTESSLLDRLSFIKRTFSNTLLLGTYSHDFIHSINATHIPYLLNDTLLDNNGWERHDLILSNLNLHWVNDLPGVLWQIKHLLKPDGLFIGAYLGGDTLKELKACFLQAEMELYGGASARVIPMTDLYSASQLLLRADFKLPVADRDTLQVDYPDLNKLMTDLRSMGLSNVMHGRHKLMSSKRLFKRVEEIYQQQHSLENGRLLATFEVIYLTGWAYHESQQKALQPGSAKLSLKQIL